MDRTWILRRELENKLNERCPWNELKQGSSARYYKI
jgi:hypothetical protein